MAQSALMKQGLEGLFNPKSQFESEADYGKKILKIAWTVEILAALTGLFIAWGQGYDIYASIDNPTASDLLGAIMGALPFVIIAVIEPTKIPLAGGFYKTKILGWKLLILASLVGLTIVTFETMFNGLERNLTNVPRQVVDANNNILFLNNAIDEKNRKLAELENEDATKSTAGITGSLNISKKAYDDFLLKEQQSVSKQTEPLRKDRDDAAIKRAGLTVKLSSEAKAGLDLQRNRIKDLNSDIASINQTTEKKISDYKAQLTSEGDQNKQKKNNQANQLKAQINDKRKEIGKLRDRTSAERVKLNNAIARMDEKLDQDVRSINIEMNTKIKKSGFFDSKDNIRKPFITRIEKITSNQESRKKSLTEGFEQNLKNNNETIGTLSRDIETIDKKLLKLTSRNPLSQKLDPSVIKKFRDEGTRKITPLQKQIAKLRNDITLKVEAQSGVAKSKGASLDARIKQLNIRIDEIKSASDKLISERKEEYDRERQRIEKEKNKGVLAVAEQKKQIPSLRSEIVAIQEEIDTNKKIKRDAAYDSQVYRLAALAYGKNDVADVTTDEIKMVSLIWFGTVAIIVATTGTILALISYILRDPEAFVERKKFSLTRRLSRLFYLFFSRLNRVLVSILNILMALIRLIFSFAEIFRGLMGIPVQRAFRRTMVAFRKRLNKPRIKVIEKEVEKVVEVEIDKVVEVEKVVEKIVEKEVPVNKVVVQEVPVEIVRKELVYVPLYSTDSGLIDTSTQLKHALPKELGGEYNGDPTNQDPQKEEAPTPDKSQQEKQDE